MVFLRNRKQKLLDKEGSKNNNNNMGIVRGEDRISELPDMLLIHIISFLPTKYAARTSVLSKRWRNVWIFTPVVDFGELMLSRHYDNNDEWSSPHYDYEDESQTKVFMNCVDRMLSFQDDMPNIRKFDLYCDVYFDESWLNALITTVVRRKVEEFVLKFSIGYNHNILSPCLFTCETLTVLELLNNYLELPELISFPRLKTLKLRYIKFMDENLTRQFFSNCPVLEELILHGCQWLDMKVVSISNTALKCLSYVGCNYGLNKCVVNIYAPSLLYFEFCEEIARDYDLHLPSLVDADINFGYMPRRRAEIGYAANKLIQGISNVKLLTMGGDAFKALSYAGDLQTALPTFYNLTHLEASAEFPKTLYSFLHFSPNVESLVITQAIKQQYSKGNVDWTQNSVPECLLMHLKSIELGEFYGYQKELKIVKLFLKNARVLQKMTITFSSPKSSERAKKSMELLLAFPKASSSCVINFL